MTQELAEVYRLKLKPTDLDALLGFYGLKLSTSLKLFTSLKNPAQTDRPWAGPTVLLEETLVTPYKLGFSHNFRHLWLSLVFS